MIFGKGKSPDEVFTPRSAEVNETMYIDRPELEEKLIQGVKGTQHLLVHGESGSGKSWLYKRVLPQLKVFYEIANLANASRFKSITKEIENTVSRHKAATKRGYTETKNAGVNVGVASGGLEHEGEFIIGEKEPVEACLEFLRQKAGGDRAVLVLDNLEAINDDVALMKELGDIIILLDDDRYSQYNVKLLIVGVPGHVREYFGKTLNRQTVANRLGAIRLSCMKTGKY